MKLIAFALRLLMKWNIFHMDLMMAMAAFLAALICMLSVLIAYGLFNLLCQYYIFIEMYLANFSPKSKDIESPED